MPCYSGSAVEQYASGDLATLIDTYGQVAVDETIGLMRVEDFIIANASYEQTAGQDAEVADTEEDGQAADDCVFYYFDKPFNNF